MEINRFEDVLGVKVQEDITEGRFVVLTTNAITGDFINVDTDLPGVKLPDTTEEATRAKFCVTFAVDNRDAPIINYTTYPWDTRGGWGGNTPAGPLTGVTMYLTHPGNQESMTIPSGQKALAFTECTLTLPSGQYVDSADIRIPGAALIVCNAADDGASDAGKPKYTASMAVGVIGFTQEYNSSNGALTIRVE